MASKALMLRVILTLKNPAKQELLQLNNLIWEGNSITGQQLYIWNDTYPHAILTEDRLSNLKVTSYLSAEGLSQASFDVLVKQAESGPPLQ